MTLYLYGRNEYKKQKQRLIIATAGIICLLSILIFFGFPLFINFSLLIDSLQGNTTVTNPKEIILPPVLDPLLEATSSAAITVSGQGTPNSTLILYLNDAEIKKLTVPDNGLFQVIILGREGLNSVSSIIVSDKNESKSSNIISTKVINKQPNLEIITPPENAEFGYENSSITVEGKTDAGNTVLVNSRLVISQSDGIFRTTVTLSEGENIIRIETTDIAGNKTNAERKVYYRP